MSRLDFSKKISMDRLDFPLERAYFALYKDEESDNMCFCSLLYQHIIYLLGTPVVVGIRVVGGIVIGCFVVDGAGVDGTTLQIQG